MNIQLGVTPLGKFVVTDRDVDDGPIGVGSTPAEAFEDWAKWSKAETPSADDLSPWELHNGAAKS